VKNDSFVTFSLFSREDFSSFNLRRTQKVQTEQKHHYVLTFAHDRISGGLFCKNLPVL
jgi:hypothetical protein